MAETWKSPRKVEEEIRTYQRNRFEMYMQMEDAGHLTRDLAISALREELEYDPPTEILVVTKELPYHVFNQDEEEDTEN